jgi:cysteine desulfurase
MKDYKHVSQLRDYIEGELKESLNVSINGAVENRLPNNSSITIKGVDAEALIVNMPSLALSTGSACTSGALEPSHVLQAIGMSRDLANNTFRIGLGRFNTQKEIEQATEIIVRSVTELMRHKT